MAKPVKRTSRELFLPSCMDPRFPGELFRKSVCWHFLNGNGKCEKNDDCKFLHPHCSECGFFDTIYLLPKKDEKERNNCVLGRLDRQSKDVRFYALDHSLDTRDMKHLEENRVNVCRHWIRHGECYRDDDCFFLHPFN